MLAKKWALIAVVMAAQLQAKGTQIASFRIKSLKALSGAKSFYNNTGRRIKVAWNIADRATGDFYAQEPLVEAGKSTAIPVDMIKRYFGSVTPSKGYDVSVEVFKVLKRPQQKMDVIVQRGFKNGHQDLMVSSKTFTKNNDFELTIDKSGNLDCLPMVANKPK